MNPDQLESSKNLPDWTIPSDFDGLIRQVRKLATYRNQTDEDVVDAFATAWALQRNPDGERRGPGRPSQIKKLDALQKGLRIAIEQAILQAGAEKGVSQQSAAEIVARSYLPHASSEEIALAAAAMIKAGNRWQRGAVTKREKARRAARTVELREQIAARRLKASPSPLGLNSGN